MTDSSRTNPRLEYFRTQIGNDLSTSISPLGRWLNGTLRAVDYGHLSIEFTVRQDMTNPMGVLHGGSAAAQRYRAGNATRLFQWRCHTRSDTPAR